VRQTKQGGRYNIPLFSLLSLLCSVSKTKKTKKTKVLYAALRGFRNSAACMAAGKSNAAMGVHGGDAGDGIRRGHVRFQLHDSTKNPIANTQVSTSNTLGGE